MVNLLGEQLPIYLAVGFQEVTEKEYKKQIHKGGGKKFLLLGTLSELGC